MVQFFRRPGPIVHMLVVMLLLAAQPRSGMARPFWRMGQPAKGRAPGASETLTYDHVHFGVPDPAKAVEWYAKYLGGQPGPAGEPNDRLLFGKTRFIFLKTDKPLPSAGSSVDHIGLSVPNLAAKIKELQTAGVKIVTPIQEERGLFKHAFIEDPWGAKIEVLQD